VPPRSAVGGIARTVDIAAAAPHEVEKQRISSHMSGVPERRLPQKCRWVNDASWRGEVSLRLCERASDSAEMSNHP